MKKQMILWTCMLLLVLAGCKKDDVQYTDRYELKGKVEKGPFVRGSEVTVYELSERLERTGISYTKTVQDDQGNFDFGILDIRSPYVEIVATVVVMYSMAIQVFAVYLKTIPMYKI